MENPLHHFFRIQKTDRYLRFKFGQFNIYFSWHPLRTRQDRRGESAKRKELKQTLLDEIGHCQHCGKELDWSGASIHHIVPRSIDPTREYDKSNLQLLCKECHVRLHQIEQLEAKIVCVQN